MVNRYIQGYRQLPYQFIDYRKHEPLPAYLAQQYGGRPFDFVLDCVGPQALFANTPAYLKASGTVVNIGALEGAFVTISNALLNSWLPTWLGGVPCRYVTISSSPLHDDAVYLAHLIQEGRLCIPVDSVFDMEDVVSAYERIVTKRACGKVVVKGVSIRLQNMPRLSVVSINQLCQGKLRHGHCRCFSVRNGLEWKQLKCMPKSRLRYCSQNWRCYCI